MKHSNSKQRNTTWKRAATLLLAVVVALSLAACELPGKNLLPGKPKATETPKATEAPEETVKPTKAPEPTEKVDSNLGEYCLYAVQQDDTYYELSAMFDDEFIEDGVSIKLKTGGKAVLVVGDEDSNGKYVIDGDEITITVDDEDFCGTIKAGIVSLEDDDVNLVFVREDADISGIELTSASALPGGVIAWGEGEMCDIEIVGAETFEDYNGDTAIRIYYDFTNWSEEAKSADNIIGIEAYQDNRALVPTYTEEDLPCEYNQYFAVRPGVTVRCFCGYKYNPNGGAVRLIINDWWEDEDILDVTLNPSALPAAPEPWYGPETIEDPWWTDDLDWEGDVEDLYVNIDSAETLEDDSGNFCIRVYYEVTNNGDEPTSASSLCYRAFQDGLELDLAYSYEEMDTDEAFYSDIAVGCTGVVSRVYILRSDSGIEVEVYSYWDDMGRIGGVFY